MVLSMSPVSPVRRRVTLKFRTNTSRMAVTQELSRKFESQRSILVCELTVRLENRANPSRRTAGAIIDKLSTFVEPMYSRSGFSECCLYSYLTWGLKCNVFEIKQWLGRMARRSYQSVYIQGWLKRNPFGSNCRNCSHIWNQNWSSGDKQIKGGSNGLRTIVPLIAYTASVLYEPASPWGVRLPINSQQPVLAPYCRCHYRRRVKQIHLNIVAMTWKNINVALYAYLTLGNVFVFEINGPTATRLPQGWLQRGKVHSRAIAKNCSHIVREHRTLRGELLGSMSTSDPLVDSVLLFLAILTVCVWIISYLHNVSTSICSALSFVSFIQHIPHLVPCSSDVPNTPYNPHTPLLFFIVI